MAPEVAGPRDESLAQAADEPSAPAGMARSTRLRGIGLVFVLYLAMTIVATWPLTPRMATATPSHWADSRLTVWILAWDAHAIAEHPTQLYQAPVLHPESDALATMEPHFTLALFAAPIIWISGNPYLAHNILFILAIPLSGLAAFLLAAELTGDRRAALVAGAAYAFAPYWLGHVIALALLKVVASWWIPAAALMTLRWMRSGRLRQLIAMTACLLFATLQSWYVGAIVGLTILIAATCSVRRDRPWGRLGRQALVAGVISAGVLTPFAIPHVREARRDPIAERTLESVGLGSAVPTSYLAAPPENWIWGPPTRRWSAPQANLESNLFPGVTIIFLAGTALVAATRLHWTRKAALVGAVITTVGVIFSLGVSVTGPKRFFPWKLLHDNVFFLRSLRHPARFHVITILGLSILVGVGARFLTRRVAMKGVATAVLVVMIFLEALSLPMKLGPATRPTRLDRGLASRPGAVLYLPAMTYDPRTELIRYYGDPSEDLMRATGHWRPLANGTFSVYTKRYLEFSSRIRSFPDQATVALFRSMGIRTVVVDTNELAGSPWENLTEELSALPEFRLIDTDGPTLAYDLSPGST